MSEKQRMIISISAIVISLAALVINIFTIHNLLVAAKLQGM